MGFMATQPKMLLMPCSGEETADLAAKIHQILINDYGLETDILPSLRRKEVASDTLKDHLHPLVSDYFVDMEANVDIGRNALKDVIRGKHIVLVEHLLTPVRFTSEFTLDGEKYKQLVSVNDHLEAIKGNLDIISKLSRNSEDTIPRVTLAAPYLSYVRSHSIAKYEKRGFFQFDSLRKTLKEYRNDGLQSIVTIDPHSEIAGQIANELEIDFHGINPFQSARAINPWKLGLSGTKAKEVMPRLRPFQEEFNKLKNKYANHLYIVSVDDGAEKRVENFAERAYPELSPEEVYSLILYLGKDRVTYANSSIGIKPFSQIVLDKLDPEGTYVVIDDMYSSGRTAGKAAKMLKDKGAKRVEVWTTHAVTMPQQYEEANNRSYIDLVRCLDTVPQHSSLNIQYICATADLMSAELYKVHQKLVTSR
jgi:phosphoribosylpyrophosphate synthetase